MILLVGRAGSIPGRQSHGRDGRGRSYLGCFKRELYWVVPLLTDRTNEDWLADLGGSGSRNRDACEGLRAMLIQRLGRALRGRGVDPATIEDFAQDGVVRVLQSLTSFRGDSKFTTWATAVALRVAYTELRRARWKDRSLDDLGVDRWPADSATSKEDDLERRSLVATMQQVIERQLTPKQRFAVLAKLEDVPQITLAGRLATNTNALYKLQHDARRKLRQGILEAGFSEADVRRILTLPSGEG